MLCSNVPCLFYQHVSSVICYPIVDITPSNPLLKKNLAYIVRYWYCLYQWNITSETHHNHINWNSIVFFSAYFIILNFSFIRRMSRFCLLIYLRRSHSPSPSVPHPLPLLQQKNLFVGFPNVINVYPGWLMTKHDWPCSERAVAVVAVAAAAPPTMAEQHLSALYKPSQVLSSALCWENTVWGVPFLRLLWLFRWWISCFILC